MTTDNADDVVRLVDGHSVYCASEKAIIAATVSYRAASGDLADPKGLAQALVMAHHPSLGSDRSVCLRDVIEALEQGYHCQNPVSMHPADYITKKFEGDGHEGLAYV